MHSGENREPFPPAEIVSAGGAKIILDGVLSFLYSGFMEKFVRKVSKGPGHFQVAIPRKMVLSKCWGDVKYVLIEDDGPDKIIIRRFMDGKSLEG